MPPPPTDPPVPHGVGEGDRMSKIVFENNCGDYTAVWDKEYNSALKKKRHNRPEILLPGDVVFLPTKTPDEHPGKDKDAQQHTDTASLSSIQLYLMVHGQSVANRVVRVHVEHPPYDGQVTTSGAGLLQFHVDPRVTEILLEVQDPPFACRLLVGQLHPIDEWGGVERRLNNLGYFCPVAVPAVAAGPKAADDEQARRNELRTKAIRRFQADAGAALTGLADDKTLSLLDAWTHDPSKPK